MKTKYTNGSLWISKFNNAVIQCDGKETDCSFSGHVINGGRKTAGCDMYEVGHYNLTWTKDSFLPYSELTAEHKEPIELYKQCISLWGERAQLEMAQEEATELALAVRKYIRVPSEKTLQAMAGEVADVEIMIEQLKQMRAELSDQVTKIKHAKLKRLQGRVNEQSFEAKC